MCVQAFRQAGLVNEPLQQGGQLLRVVGIEEQAVHAVAHDLRDPADPGGQYRYAGVQRLAHGKAIALHQRRHHQHVDPGQYFRQALEGVAAVIADARIGHAEAQLVDIVALAAAVDLQPGRPAGGPEGDGQRQDVLHRVNGTQIAESGDGARGGAIDGEILDAQGRDGDVVREAVTPVKIGDELGRREEQVDAGQERADVLLAEGDGLFQVRLAYARIPFGAEHALGALVGRLRPPADRVEFLDVQLGTRTDEPEVVQGQRDGKARLLGRGDHGNGHVLEDVVEMDQFEGGGGEEGAEGALDLPGDDAGKYVAAGDVEFDQRQALPGLGAEGVVGPGGVGDRVER